MAILNRVGSVLVTGLAAAAVFGLSTAEMPAAVTWTSPGGTITGTSTSAGITLTDLSSSASIPCTSGTMTATLKKGTGLAGKAIGKITQFSATGCAVSGIGVTVAATGLPWKINLASYKNGVSTGTISGIKATMSVSLIGCTGVIGGKASGSAGTISITYTNPTTASPDGTLKVIPVLPKNAAKSKLWIQSASSSCPSEVAAGNSATIGTTAMVTPPTTITSP